MPAQGMIALREKIHHGPACRALGTSSLTAEAGIAGKRGKLSTLFAEHSLPYDAAGNTSIIAMLKPVS